MGGGACALVRMVNGLAVMGKSWPRPKVGVRCGGDHGVDSCVQVGVKTLGGLVFV